jgi:hypothetical protein
MAGESTWRKQSQGNSMACGARPDAPGSQGSSGGEEWRPGERQEWIEGRTHSNRIRGGPRSWALSMDGGLPLKARRVGW